MRLISIIKPRERLILIPQRLIAILLVGWSSDRTGERRWHTALPMIAASVGLILAVMLQERLALSVGMFCLAAAGIYAYCPGFWSLPTSFLSGTAAAASIGLINSVGNLGGYAGPHMVGYLSTATGSFLVAYSISRCQRWWPRAWCFRFEPQSPTSFSLWLTSSPAFSPTESCF